MRPFRRVSRRSFLATVTGAAATGGGIVAADGALAFVQGCSDTDPISAGGDPGGRGRRCQGQSQSLPQTGCSDSDPTDPIGRGRRCTPQSYSGCSDADPTDPGGQGRNCQGQPSTGCSDSDPTDPGGRGRSCSGGSDGQMEQELASGAWQWSGLPILTRFPRAAFSRSRRGGGTVIIQDGVYTFTGSWRIERGRLSITLVDPRGPVFVATLSRDGRGGWTGALGGENYAATSVSLFRM